MSPHTVRKQGKRWAIVRADTGRVVGHSTSKRKAAISASIRDQRAGDAPRPRPRRR
jgi:hypothetical protein